jgi:hypothetical protein
VAITKPQTTAARAGRGLAIQIENSTSRDGARRVFEYLLDDYECRRFVPWRRATAIFPISRPRLAHCESFLFAGDAGDQEIEQPTTIAIGN